MPTLVLDGDQPSALAIVRSLGRQAVRVTVGSAVEHPLAGYSRFAQAQVRYPDPLREEQAFVAWLEQRQREQPDELVIPVTERTVVPILRQRSRLQDQRMREALVGAIKNLPEREQYVMSMYYEHDMNLKEIAAVIGVTESRVCQLHSQSIARLRSKLRAW